MVLIVTKRRNRKWLEQRVLQTIFSWLLSRSIVELYSERSEIGNHLEGENPNPIVLDRFPEEDYGDVPFTENAEFVGMDLSS